MSETVTYCTEKTAFEDSAIKLAEQAVSLYKKAGYEVKSMKKNVVFDRIEFIIIFNKKGAKNK